MKILFIDRPISRAPLEVLQHLYYYTVQYGLSVKQFTGKHWKYWEELPFHLEKAKDSPKKLSNVINELKKLSLKSDERLKKRRIQLKKWKEKEIIINAQLMSLLAALPERLLAIAFGHLTNLKEFPSSCKVVYLKIEGIKGEDLDFVEPDILLLGKSHLLMVEIKTRGGDSSSRNYPPAQLLNYMKLVAECRKSSSDSLPSSFSHLILVPSKDKRWLEVHSTWVKKIYNNNGLLQVNNQFFNKFIKKTIRKDKQLVIQALKKTSICYRSWDDLVKSFRFAIRKYNDKTNSIHWDRIGNELKNLAEIATSYI